MKLNIGAGSVYKKDYINIDNLKNYKRKVKRLIKELTKRGHHNVDMYVVAEANYLPFKDNSIDSIESTRFIGRLFDELSIAIIFESHRVLKDGGDLIIRCADTNTLEQVINIFGNISAFRNPSYPKYTINKETYEFEYYEVDIIATKGKQYAWI